MLPSDTKNTQNPDQVHATTQQPSFSNVSLTNQPSRAISDQALNTKRHKLVTPIIFTIIIILLFGASLVEYRLIKLHVANVKFNKLAYQIKIQELTGAKNKMQIDTILNDIEPIISSTSTVKPPFSKVKLDNDIKNLATILNTNCKAKSSEITPDTIDDRVKGLMLNKSEKLYIKNIKHVTQGLVNSEYTSTGICNDGRHMFDIVRNFALFLPGFAVYNNVVKNDTVSNADINTLKSFTNLTLYDQGYMQENIPDTSAWLLNEKNIFSDLFYVSVATIDGDRSKSLKYSTDAAKLSWLSSSYAKKSSTELQTKGIDNANAASQASNAEIGAIDSQLKNPHPNTNIQLDYTLPSFRIVESGVRLFALYQNGTYPAGTSVNDIAQHISAATANLQYRGLLKNITYTSLGSDNSGFRLSAVLADGTKLSEQRNPKE